MLGKLLLEVWKDFGQVGLLRYGSGILQWKQIRKIWIVLEKEK